MNYKKTEIDGKPVYNCIGDGQCWCKRCEWNGRFGLHWTSFMYCLEPKDDAPIYCGDCIREILKEK